MSAHSTLAGRLVDALIADGRKIAPVQQVESSSLARVAVAARLTGIRLKLIAPFR
jgi:hypothetical protein